MLIAALKKLKETAVQEELLRKLMRKANPTKTMTCRSWYIA
jgi:hypothetical protein